MSSGNIILNPLGSKVHRRLAVVPSDPLAAYDAKGNSFFRKDYYNPTNFFTEVFCLSPIESKEYFKYGMHIIPTSAEQLSSRIRELGIDVVRAYGGYWACDYVCENKVEGVPVVVSVHDTNPEILHNSIHKADYIFAVSQAVKNLLIERGVPQSKVSILPNRVDLDIFSHKSDGNKQLEFSKRFPGKYKILHVGRKTEQKNLDTLIHSLSYLGTDYSAIFVGLGDKVKYEQLAKDLSVANRCYFVDSVPNGELANYYSFCDCMCTPSRWEGFGIVFIEALACQAIVVTSDIAPMNEFIIDGHNGLLVKDFESPNEIASAINIACNDSYTRSRLFSNARKAATKFDKYAIDQLEAKLYDNIIGENKGGNVNNAWLHLNKLLEQSINIIDLGCGTTPIARATVGVDLYVEPLHRLLGSGKAIDKSTFDKLGMRFVQQSIDTDLPFKENEFDFAYSHHSIEHVEDPAKSCDEMMRIAERGVIIAPSIFAETIFGRKYHKWLVHKHNDILCFFEKPPELDCPFGEHPNVFDKILNDGNWYNAAICSDLTQLRMKIQSLWETHHPLIETVFLWEGSFKYLVVKADGTVNSNILKPCDNNIYDNTDSSKMKDRNEIYRNKLPIYRTLTEYNLSDLNVRHSTELLNELNKYGMGKSQMDVYWERVSFISKNCYGNVLEIGCGCGNITRYISQNKRVSSITAIDHLTEYITLLKYYDFPKVKAFCTDALSFNTLDEFDCVVLAECIEHLTQEEENELLLCLNKMLKANTQFIITTPIGFMPDPDHVRGFSPEEFASHLTRYYGTIAKLGSNGIQQFAVVNFVLKKYNFPNPLVTVVLPTYNHLSFLPKSIESILAQTFTDFELIIVNDGSTDGTKEYLDSLSDPRIQVIHQENRRLPGALNTGFCAANGKLLTWVSADNYCAPKFLEVFVTALKTHPEAGLAYSAFEWIDENGGTLGTHQDQDFSLHNLLRQNPGTASFMYRRECQEVVGLYDSSLEGAEDWDYWIRIRENFNAVYIPDVLNYYRLHPKSMTTGMPEKVRQSACKTFNNFIVRNGFQLPIEKLYPHISACVDKRKAMFYAYIDFGNAMLSSEYFDQAHAVQASYCFEKSLEIGNYDNVLVFINLTLVYARMGEWDTAIKRVFNIQLNPNPEVQDICQKIKKAVYNKDASSLSACLPLTFKKYETELFVKEAMAALVYRGKAQ